MLEAYLDRISESSDPAEMAVFAVFCDIKGRRGLGDEMENTDDDIMVKMLEGWVVIVRDGPTR